MATTYFPITELGDSIVGADLFHDSVRDEKRWYQIAQVTMTRAIISYKTSFVKGVFAHTNDIVELSMIRGKFLS